MPRKGFKNLTIDEKLHGEIKRRAEETNCTIREYIERLLTKDKTSKDTK